MGCLAVKRWLSFLPAGFVVYVLLHYLVYQPDLATPPHSPLIGGGNVSVVGVGGGGGGRSLQSGPRVLPPLTPDPTTAPSDPGPDDPPRHHNTTQTHPGGVSQTQHLTDLESSPLTASSSSSSTVRTSSSSSSSSRTAETAGTNESGVVIGESGALVGGGTGSRSSVSAGGSAGKSGAAAGGTTISGSSSGKTAVNSSQSRVVVVQGTGSAPQPRTVTKKTTIIKKSSVTSSTSLAINALKGRVKVGERYESGFSVPQEELCPNNGRELKVLVLITTAPDHEKHRTAVRQTWGHFAGRKDVVMAFMIGRMGLDLQARIDHENEIYGDIIQANFVDHYSNLTLKTVAMFEWIKTYCSESHFVLKTDDDMFINMPLLLSFVESKPTDTRVIYGRMAKGWKPVRNKKSKYYIDTNTYSKARYPDFLTGPAYLLTADVVEDIYHKALDTTFFVLEDVLLTGIVAESLKIRRVGDSRFRNEKIKLTDTCTLIKTISIHMVKYEEQFDIYKKTLDGRAKCKAG